MSTRKIGVLWKPKKESKARLTGVIEFLGEQIHIGIFPNTEKKEPNHPDYSIVRFLNDDKPAQQDDFDQQPPPSQDKLPF
jgi:hypothetical protein